MRATGRDVVFSALVLTSIIYASARALRSDKCKPITWRTLERYLLRPVGVRPPRADATKFLFPPRGRALEEASRASGLGLPGDGIAGPRDGVERGHGRELQRHGPMSRARWTVYVPTATAGRFRGGAAGGRFINLYRIPSRPLKPFLLSFALVS